MIHLVCFVYVLVVGVGVLHDGGATPSLCRPELDEIGLGRGDPFPNPSLRMGLDRDGANRSSRPPSIAKTDKLNTHVEGWGV